MDVKQKEYMVIHESTYDSWAIDICTFGCIAFLLWFNANYLGNNGFVAVTFIILVWMTVANRLSGRFKRFTSEEDAIKYLESKKK